MPNLRLRRKGKTHFSGVPRFSCLKNWGISSSIVFRKVEKARVGRGEGTGEDYGHSLVFFVLNKFIFNAMENGF